MQNQSMTKAERLTNPVTFEALLEFSAVEARWVGLRDPNDVQAFRVGLIAGYLKNRNFTIGEPDRIRAAFWVIRRWSSLNGELVAAQLVETQF